MRTSRGERIFVQMPQCDQQSSQGRECFKPRLRGEWDNSVTEHYLEQRLADTPLDCEALEEKARFNSMIAARGVHELSHVAYVIVASAIANSGMLYVSPAGCGKSVLLKQVRLLVPCRRGRVAAAEHAGSHEQVAVSRSQVHVFWRLRGPV